MVASNPSYLRRINRALRAISECNELLVRATEEEILLGEVCQIMVETGGHRFAWVGFLQQDTGETVQPVAHAGSDVGYLDKLGISLNCSERSGRPIAKAIRTGKFSVIRDVRAGGLSTPWREEAVKRGYASVIALPLTVEGNTFGGMEIYSAEKDAFDDEEVGLLTDLANNLAFGVISIRTRQERVRAEAENTLLKAAIEQSAEGVVITDPQGRIEYINPAFTRMTGYNREEVIGQTLRLLRSRKHDRQFYAQLWKTILSGEVWRGEIVNRRKDGSLYTEAMTVTPVRDAQGALSHFIAVKEDITSRKQLEEQLWRAQKMEAVGRLAGGVAHDFNNLLTVIRGYADILSNSLPPKDASLRASVDEILKASERAASLTRQLLAFSRQQVLAPKVLDLNHVVGGVEKMLHRLIGEDIELVTTLQPDLGPVRADPGQIEQVLVNLAVNSRDAMPQGGRLSIETRNIDLDGRSPDPEVVVKPGPYVEIRVQDTGCGMDEETRSRIFEPFFTTKEKGKGTGLGLATVYGIVKQSGGYIWVSSEPGQGTTFRIHLPRVNESKVQAEHSELETSVRRGTETILIVEDEDGVRALCHEILLAQGYQVLEAGDGEAAFTVLRQHPGPIHLLLTDVVMPRMSGREVAEKLGMLFPGLKVLYMSGYTNDAAVLKGLLDSGVAFLQKPFTRDSLARKVREVLDARPHRKV
jgi:two-component system cell cycle sensor histidine kinase/response regulator CckA